MPILIDEQGELIAGHGRVLAARQLELETVPTMTARGWSEAKIRAYRIADNKLGLNSGWDDELLALELADLRELGADLTTTGFDAASLESLLAGPKSPEAFDEYDENIETEHECPKCGFKWSGGGHATRKAADDEAA